MQTIDEVQTALAAEGYMCSRALATVVFLSQSLGRPLFLEGEAGTGETEIAKAIASALGRRLSACNATKGWTRHLRSMSGISPNR